MTLRILGAVLGVATVAVGLALGPAPWLALIWTGGTALAAALLVDDGQPAEPA
jgi:hypothetical protein